MKSDNRLSDILHVLLHMLQKGEAVVSDQLAVMLSTNPVVVRRTLSGLRAAGLVASEKGHGGGWVVARDPAQISLHDIYEALGSPPLFHLGHRSASPTCLVEKAVNRALDETLMDAETLLLNRFRTVTLADLQADFSAGFAQHGHHTLADLWAAHRQKGDPNA